ncbi:hypothetical protein GCM10025868_29510 [Angustibacter aerolatus]|uniref:Uncharacterized protein n=1 Tax=Angustibacter aerolatus TaxID=1162965 RepID=A0ABQ6JHJ5_9ACTN|nr:hypothetical protein [Angustibacter aerolatus]GMA87701.1 hypothetical protein GCM10025868_29510 [Angustibacter aerolatus]
MIDEIATAPGDPGVLAVRASSDSDVTAVHADLSRFGEPAASVDLHLVDGVWTNEQRLVLDYGYYDTTVTATDADGDVNQGGGTSTLDYLKQPRVVSHSLTTRLDVLHQHLVAAGEVRYLDPRDGLDTHPAGGVIARLTVDSTTYDATVGADGRYSASLDAEDRRHVRARRHGLADARLLVEGLQRVGRRTGRRTGRRDAGPHRAGRRAGHRAVPREGDAERHGAGRRRRRVARAPWRGGGVVRRRPHRLRRGPHVGDRPVLVRPGPRAGRRLRGPHPVRQHDGRVRGHPQRQRQGAGGRPHRPLVEQAGDQRVLRACTSPDG